MHEGKVVHFEDFDGWRRLVHRQLDGSGHEVVAEAHNLPDALSLLDRIRTGEINANIVITDGNLGNSAESRDAKQITEHIKFLGLPVRIVGLASDPMAEFGISVDADLTKESLKPGQLKQVIDDLPEPEGL